MPKFAKPKDQKQPRKRRNHSIRNKRRTKRGMVLDLDKVARREIVEERDGNECQRCGRREGEYRPHDGETGIRAVVIQWCHVHTREYLLTRWEPDNSFAGCDACHVWFDNHKVLGFDWFVKKFPERWERVNRILQARLLTEGHCRTTDAWVRALWLERCAGDREK